MINTPLFLWFVMIAVQIIMKDAMVMTYTVSGVPQMEY